MTSFGKCKQDFDILFGTGLRRAPLKVALKIVKEISEKLLIKII